MNSCLSLTKNSFCHFLWKIPFRRRNQHPWSQEMSDKVTTRADHCWKLKLQRQLQKYKTKQISFYILRYSIALFLWLWSVSFRIGFSVFLCHGLAQISEFRERNCPLIAKTARELISHKGLLISGILLSWQNINEIFYGWQKSKYFVN